MQPGERQDKAVKSLSRYQLLVVRVDIFPGLSFACRAVAVNI